MHARSHMSAGIISGEACFVIHTRPYRETSVIADLMCLNCGRISAVARAARHPASPFRGTLQPFTSLLATMARGRGGTNLWKLRFCQREGQAFDLKAPAVFCATYLNELLYHLWHSEEGSAVLFASYLQTLQTLVQPDLPQTAIAGALRRFELTLLETLGYGIDLTGDVTGGGFMPGGSYSYEPGRGFRRATGDEPGLTAVFEGWVLNDLRAENWTAGGPHGRVLQQITHVVLERLLGRRVILSRDLYRGYMQALHRAADAAASGMQDDERADG